MPQPDRLRLYGTESDTDALDWEWVDAQLQAAGTYWVVPRSSGHPHPRPVWGVWQAGALFLSIGTPANNRDLASDPRLTVHLDSGTEVVILEGSVSGSSREAHVVTAYNSKYDYDYDLDTFGPLTVVSPTRVLSWRSQGWAGREGFHATGRWTF